MTVKYTAEILISVVKESYSISEVLRKLGCKGRGTTHAHVKKRIISCGLDISHFTGQSSDSSSNFGSGKLDPTQILTLDRNKGRREHAYMLRRAMVDSGFPYVCSMCQGQPEWLGRKLVLEIDHVDGNSLNNLKDNLRFLCPNCHSQTETYGIKRLDPIHGPKTYGRLGRPKLSEEEKELRRNVDDKAVKEMYNNTPNYTRVGEKFGISAKVVKRIVSSV